MAEYKSDVCNVCIQFEFEISGGFTWRFSCQEWSRLQNVKSFQRWTTILNEKDDCKKKTMTYCCLNTRVSVQGLDLKRAFLILIFRE